ncbi:archaellin/type IV pilin N-terminal domain-containing protein [Thermofilum adornatum]|nr:archaellin/type IV pilin N-terminal domain-containing protein [Thermofilum adornatum]
MKRTGVSPVIATLLLIVIAVAAAVLAYIWIIGYQGTLTQQASTAQLQERIKIEAVQYDSGTNTLTVYVRNIGDVNVVIDALYLYDKTGTAIGQSTGVGLTLNPGEVKSGTVSLTGGLTSGQTYTVKAVTQKGTEATYTFTYRT